MTNCKKCGYKMILATGTIDIFDANSEPYESGKIEEAEIEEFYNYCSVSIHVCPKCNHVQDYSIDEMEGSND